jgi:hypothetical protein
MAAGRDQDTLNLPSRYSGNVLPEPPSSAGTSFTVRSWSCASLAATTSGFA